MTDELAEQIRDDLSPRGSASAALDELRAAEDEAEAKRLGVDVKFVRAGREFGEDAEELAALDGCTTASEVEEAMAGLAARREARAEAEHQARVTEEAKRL